MPIQLKQNGEPKKVQKNKMLKELILLYELKGRAKTEDKFRMYNFDEVRSFVETATRRPNEDD